MRIVIPQLATDWAIVETNAQYEALVGAVSELVRYEKDGLDLENLPGSQPIFFFGGNSADGASECRFNVTDIQGFFIAGLRE